MPRAAEEQRLLLEVALVNVLCHCRVEMVHLVLGAVAGDAEPGKEEKGGKAAVPGLGGCRVLTKGFLVLNLSFQERSQ